MSKTATANIPPRLWAQAIAELLDDEVRKAWTYIDRLSYLRDAGMPADDARVVLDRPRQPTDALDKVAVWAKEGSPGCLALVGERGVGKGYAAGWWAIRSREQGRTARWLSAKRWGALEFPALRKLLRAAEVAPALVLDDVGAGASSSDYARESLQGMVETRVESARPTLILANGTREEMAAWLGPRAVDRMHVGGGIAVCSGQSMRAVVGSRPSVDDRGLGPIGQRARRVVEIVGCERDRQWLGRWERGHDGGYYEVGGGYQHTWIVGRKLHTAATCSGLRAIEVAIAALGLDRAEVEAKARKLAADDKIPDLEMQLETALANLVVSKRAEDLARRDRLGKELAADRQRFACRAATPGPGMVIDVKIPARLQGREGESWLQSVGYTVTAWRGQHVLTFGSTVLASGTLAECWDAARSIAARDMLAAHGKTG